MPSPHILPRSKTASRIEPMKRLLAVIVLVVIAALTAYYITRQHPAAVPSTIANLLPADTALFIHLPDAEKNREAWHRTDLCQLYLEPAVQDFLQKPKSHLLEKSSAKEVWNDFSSLRIRNGFLATNSFDSLRLTAGFEFRCDEKAAQAVIERWKSRLLAKATDTQRSSVDYEKHKIDIFSSGQFIFASTVVGRQFLAATTVEDLKALLDRADGRTKAPALDSDENFRAAMKQMPAEYAWMFYLQPKQLAQKLVNLRAETGRALPTDQRTLIERIQSYAHAMVFDGARIRDIGFAAMPQLSQTKLERTTLALAPAETLLYGANVVNMQQQFDSLLEPAGTMAGPLQSISNALTSAGVTKEDWKAAFGDEISVMAAWPANAQMPNAVFTVGVRDRARARKIADAIASSSGWQKISRNNAEYYAGPTSGMLAVVSPTIAISDRFLVAGLNAASVDGVISPTAAGGGLASSEKFRSASKLVPDPSQIFVYLDLAELYSRLDATVRPILQVGAAFVPSLSQGLDPDKLPPTEVVTKRLSPVVASTSYVNGGYRSESAGTITIEQAAIAGGAAYVGAMIFRQHQAKGGAPAVMPTPVARQSPSPGAVGPLPTP
jgi:Protein of unknown function (DUF3352)